MPSGALVLAAFPVQTGSPEGIIPRLPPGVVDTRPKGMRFVDLRDGVLDGVLDTRAQGLPVVAPAVPRSRQPEVRLVDMWDHPRSTEQTVHVDEPPSSLFMPIAGTVVSPPARKISSPAPTSMRRSELRRREAGRSSRRPQTSSLSVPQVGIASALGLATIAAPLTGALAVPANSAPVRPLVVAAAALAPAFPQVQLGPVNAVDDPRIVTDDSLQASVPWALAAPSRLLVTRVSRGSERPVLPGCTGQLPSFIASAVNGKMPPSSLCTLWDSRFSLRADAAVSFAKLNVAYNQRFGRSICVIDSYRTLAKQYAVKAQRGSYAATPGTSEHGWGLAVDLCGGSSVANTPTYTWLRANGTRYGWGNPDWARPGGGGPYEPWHWEYLVGEADASGGD